jgi:hypothetical protein
MSDKGFIQIPRSLLNHPSVRKAPVEQFKVLITLIANLRYSPELFDDHGLIFEVQVGEICITYDELAKLADVDRNHAVRAIKRFSEFKKIVTFDKEIFESQILTYEVKRKKTLIKIVHKETYDLIKNQSEMKCDTKVKRSRNESETQKNKDNKENKENKENVYIEKVISIDEGQENQVAVNQDFSESEIKHNVHYQSFSPLNYSKPSKKKEAVPASPLAAELLAAFNSSLLKNIPEVAGKPASSQDAKHFDKLLKDYSSEEIQSVIDFSHKDNFWSQHVHTPNYLKLKFSKLLAASRRKKKEILPLKDSIRDEIKERFKHGQEYNGAECYINEDSIAFTRGMTHHQIRFTEKGFWDQFNNILRKLGINENGF